MSKPINREPYYDDYDKGKNYTTILAVPGKVEQAREFTQAQTALYDYIGRLGNSILENGSIVEGCIATVNANKVSITEGKVFVDGLVRILKPQVIDILGVGSEAIGVKLETTIVTEDRKSVV